MKILFADDHSLVRKIIRKIIVEAYPTLVLYEVADGNAVTLKAAQENWDIIISDFSMPGPGGIKLIKKLRKLSPDTPIIILSTHPPEQYSLRAINAGASGYLVKAKAEDQLINLINELCNKNGTNSQN